MALAFFEQPPVIKNVNVRGTSGDSRNQPAPMAYLISQEGKMITSRRRYAEKG